jgi:hypothetical protein
MVVGTVITSRIANLLSLVLFPSRRSIVVTVSLLPDAGKDGFLVAVVVRSGFRPDTLIASLSTCWVAKFREWQAGVATIAGYESIHWRPP